MKKELVISIALLLGVIITYYFVTYFLVQANFNNDKISNEIKFDKELWITGTIRQRGQMLNNLQDSIILIDKTKDEILYLLGSPDSENDIIDGEYRSKFNYSIDRGHPFTYDMILLFDSTNHVKFILFDD